MTDSSAIEGTTRAGEGTAGERCRASVMPSGMRFPRPRQCERAGRVLEGGKWYCKMHAPSAVAVKKAERSARWEEESERNMRNYRLQAAARQIYDAAVALLNSPDFSGNTHPLFDDLRAGVAGAGNQSPAATPQANTECQNAEESK